MVVVIDEPADSGFKISWEVIVLQQDAVRDKLRMFDEISRVR